MHQVISIKNVVVKCWGRGGKGRAQTTQKSTKAKDSAQKWIRKKATNHVESLISLEKLLSTFYFI